MRALIQRVTRAGVEVEGEVVGRIDAGLLILLGIAPDDTPATADRLADKAVNLRIFSDPDGKFNLSLLDTVGGCLVVSQFTLYADCRKGRRPSFTDAAPPAAAERMYQYFVQRLGQLGVARVATGRFGAHMRVDLLNDGPVTILLDSADWSA